MEYKIYVGAAIKIKNGFLKGAFRFIYCGMSSESVFVLAPLRGVGYQGYSPNIYYSIDSRVIQIFEKTFDVLEVTPEYIILGD